MVLDIRLHRNWNLHANTHYTHGHTMLMLLTLIIWEWSITIIIICMVDVIWANQSLHEITFGSAIYGNNFSSVVRGQIHETFLRRNFFLTAIFFLFFNLRKKLRIFCVPKHSS